MTGMDGINSLQKMLGALTVNSSTNVSGAAAAGKAGSSQESSVKISSNTVDSANLSAAGGLASSQATDTSDVRMTKVSELKAAIASGSYNVSASAVADKMVEGMLR